MRFQWKNIVDGFDYTYSSIEGPYIFFKRIRFYSLLRLLIRLTANLVIPFYFDLTRGNSDFRLGSNKKTSNRIVVSLTSFPVRINRIWLVIETILRQTQKPDKIILWLSNEQFPSLDLLPQKLLKQRDRGLEIELRDSDLLSHKKYYYTLREFPDDIMITFDDDIFYPTSTIEELMEWHKIFPDAVIARYGSKIRVVDHEIAPYKSWEQSNNQEFPGFQFFFGSGGGVLFPVHTLPEDTLNKDIFMNTCLYADDIWLNTMCRLNNRKIFKMNTSQCSLLPVINKNNISLYSKNLDENRNDIQLRNVRDHFILNRGIDPYLEILH